MQKKFPVLGFIGLTLIVLGVLAGVCANSGWSLYLIITGAAVLVFALFAGHVKLFG
jgi:membrane-bound ClpP family serine protease